MSIQDVGLVCGRSCVFFVEGMAEEGKAEDFSDGIESNYEDPPDLVDSSPSDNPMISGFHMKKEAEERRDSSSLLSRMMNFGKERLSGISKANPLAENTPRLRRSRHNSSELLASSHTEKTGSDTLDSSAGEEEEGDGTTIVVGKSRDGKPFFEALKNLQVSPHYPSLQEIQTLTSREQEYCRGSPSLAKTIDRCGLEYFAKLDQCWEIISRAEMVPPQSIDESPGINFRELSDSSAFTEIYETELDLRRRPLRDLPKRAFSELPDDCLNSIPHRESLVTHFQNFVKQHDQNWNLLQNLVHGNLLLPIPPFSALLIDNLHRRD